MVFCAYLLRCNDGSYYAGHTDNLEARLAQHQTGALAGYTAARLPVELVWSEAFPTRDEAFAAERRIKGWSRAKNRHSSWAIGQVFSNQLAIARNNSDNIWRRAHPSTGSG